MKFQINYELLSRNDKIPFSYVLKFKQEKWNWISVINNILTEYDYQIYLEDCHDLFLRYLPYMRNGILDFKNLSVKFIYELFDKYKNYHSLMNDNFMYALSQKAPLEFILEHNDLQWIWYVISRYNKTIKNTDII